MSLFGSVCEELRELKDFLGYLTLKQLNSVLDMRLDKEHAVPLLFRKRTGLLVGCI